MQKESLEKQADTVKGLKGKEISLKSDVAVM